MTIVLGICILCVIVDVTNGIPIKPSLGECPRGYVIESRVGCQAGPEVRCHDDGDCPALSRCCYNGCGMSCLYVSILVKNYCVADGARYHPGEQYQRGCSMCKCEENGVTETCEEMPNCGQPQLTMLPDGPIKSDEVTPSTVPPNIFK